MVTQTLVLGIAFLALSSGFLTTTQPRPSDYAASDQSG